RRRVSFVVFCFCCVIHQLLPPGLRAVLGHGDCPSFSAQLVSNLPVAVTVTEEFLELLLIHPGLFGNNCRHMPSLTRCRRPSHLSQLLKKYFSEHVELKPRPLVFRGKFQFGDHFAECCRSLTVPTWPMLSPIAELSLQTGNRTPNLQFAATKCKFCPQSDE